MQGRLAGAAMAGLRNVLHVDGPRVKPGDGGGKLSQVAEITLPRDALARHGYDRAR
jgi:hypothetical protein